MRIAVVSDTHGYFDLQLAHLLRGFDEIFHAGDVGSRPVLDQFRGLAPLVAVRGNVDAAVLELEPTVTCTRAGVTLYMLHELPKSQSLVRDWAQSHALPGKQAEHCRRFLESFPQEAQVVIFGHSHEPCAIVLGGKLFFNPGSAGKRRFSLPRCFGSLEISSQGVRAAFISLDRYNEDLPEGVTLPIGGAST